MYVGYVAVRDDGVVRGEGVTEGVNEVAEHGAREKYGDEGDAEMDGQRAARGCTEVGRESIEGNCWLQGCEEPRDNIMEEYVQ